jgi:prephenate dehydrogenase
VAVSADRLPLRVLRADTPGGPPPIFERIAIIGLDRVGGSIALAARQAWPSGLVIGVDSNDVLENAMLLHAVDVGSRDLSLAEGADLVVLATPLEQSLELIRQLADRLDREAVVTDVASVKSAIVEAARALPPRLQFIGGHPIVEGPAGGLERARPDLFAGRPWLFTPEAAGEQRTIARLFAFVTALGALPRSLDPSEHDRLFAPPTV